jgi:effector-binding domain-containing protein
MIDTPQIVQTEAQQTAAIYINIPKDEIHQVMGPGFGELMSTLGEQGIQLTGPLFSHHLQPPCDRFEFEICAPIAQPVKESGRVKNSSVPAAKVARTTYHGGYEGLGDAWGEFHEWMDAQGLKTGPSFCEVYSVGPGADAPPSEWQTELSQTLVD